MHLGRNISIRRSECMDASSCNMTETAFQMAWPKMYTGYSNENENVVFYN